jgi:DNA/RNA-binding domain of Phe-tRNA-synthetase-like protein
MTGAVHLDISEIAGDFPSFRVALVVAEDLVIACERSPALETFIRDAEARLVASLGDAALADIPELARWRETYREFGVKKTSYRSSVERLLKNLQRGAGLPRVNTLVDAYNAVSAMHRMAVGADDMSLVNPPLAFRYARPGDTFVALGDPAATPDPPKPGEVVYADAEKCLCRRWNWYQDARSAVGPQTTRAVLTVQSLTADESQLRAAAENLAELIGRFAGGRAHWDIADAGRPQVSVATSSAPDQETATASAKTP